MKAQPIISRVRQLAAAAQGVSKLAHSKRKHPGIEMNSTRSRRAAVFAVMFILAPTLSRGQTGREENRESETRSRPWTETRDRALPLNEENPAPSTRVAGPGLGMIFDPARGGLRPILGLPGAATVGGVLDLGSEFSLGWISPRQEYALGRLKEGADLVLVNLDRDQISVEPLPGAMPGVDRVALSPAGASAVLYDAESRRMQLIRGLPRAYSVVAEADISTLAGAVGAMAVSDDAGAALFFISEGESGAVYSIAAGGELKWVSAAEEVSAISFLTDLQDALIADRRANAVLLVRDVAGAAGKTVLAAEQDGILNPVAAQISDDHRRVFVANSGSATVSVLDLTGGPMTQVPCSRVPSGMYRLTGSSVFRLTEFSEAPLLLLDGGADEPRIFFIPPPVEARSETEEPAEPPKAEAH
jgi:hypothetical protein